MQYKMKTAKYYNQVVIILRPLYELPVRNMETFMSSSLRRIGCKTGLCWK